MTPYEEHVARHLKPMCGTLEPDFAWAIRLENREYALTYWPSTACKPREFLHQIRLANPAALCLMRDIRSRDPSACAEGHWLRGRKRRSSHEEAAEEQSNAS